MKKKYTDIYQFDKKHTHVCFLKLLCSFFYDKRSNNSFLIQTFFSHSAEIRSVNQKRGDSTVSLFQFLIDSLSFRLQIIIVIIIRQGFHYPFFFEFYKVNRIKFLFFSKKKEKTECVNTKKKTIVNQMHSKQNDMDI